MAKVFQFITSPLSIIDKDFAKGAQAVALIVAGIVTGNPAFIMAGAARGASLFEKAPGIPASQIDRLNASVDPRAFRKTVLGQTAMPVDIRYEEWSGKDQDYCDWIVLHASHACDGLEEIWFDTEMAWSATTGVVGKYAGYFSVPHIVLEGSSTNAFTIASGKWNAASARLTGCAYSHWRFKVSPNSKKSTSPFASGLPSRITVIGRGAKLYDPRRDSTVPGGSGPMRADDQSTWRYTANDGAVIGENLPLHALRVVLGWRIRNPATGEMMLATGSGVPPRRLDLASWITAANLADEAVNRSAGGTEPRYHGASVVSEGDDPKSTLDMICTGCCGRFHDTGGRLSFDIAHNDLAVAATDDGLTDDDVIGGWTWDPDAALESTPNVVRGRYVDATTASLYQMIDYPEVRLASPDGQDRIFPLDLGVVESPSQAQRIARQVLQRKQYPRAFTATFDIRAWKYAVGDVVAFTFAPLSFNRRLFRVQEQELGQGGACLMTLTVEAAAIYAWDKDDAAPVSGAEPIVYDSRLNPLVLAIDEAATTANWSSVTGAAKPADYADVTADAIDHSRFALCTSADRIGTEIRSRFDPVFWTCNFPNTMIASLRASGDTLQADAVFHQRDHLLGIIWESVDRWDHPTTGYDTDRDYRGCQLSFRLQLTGTVLPIDDVAGPVLTVEGRDATGAARTWYVRLANLVTSGGSRDARIRIDFDALRGGFYADDPVFAGDIDRMFLSLVPEGYSAGGGRLSGPTEGGLILSEMVALGSRATLTCGTGPGGVHEVRMTNGYDDTYNVSPARIVRNLRLLGYKDRLVHYVGMSHYFRWSWNSGESRYIAEDVTEPLNRPCSLWHGDFAARLRAAGIQLVLSLSYEMLDSFAPAAFRQRDASGAPALTGWSPPSTLFSPCHAGAMAYLQRVARQFSAIVAQAGHPVHFQVGEPWYWIDFRSRVPYFYDAATTAAYTAETGKTAPRIDTMATTMTADQIAYLDWLGGKLAASILGLLAAVRADHPQAVRYALLYLPQMLDTATPEAMRVNLPRALQWPALDVLQLEDYDYVVDNRPDLSATGRAVAEQRLGYPRSRQEYFAGFALHRDTGQIWRQTTSAMQAAYEHGVFPIYVWAYTQVMRDGYAPRVRMAPALGVADIHDIDLTAEPDDGTVLVFDTKRRKWVPGKPWLATN